MRTALKIVLIIVAFLVYCFIILIVKGLQGQSSNSPGVGGGLGIVFMIAFLAGARAIWKYNPGKKTDNDNHQLDKK